MNAFRRFVRGDSLREMFDNPRKDPCSPTSENSTGSSIQSPNNERQEPQTEAQYGSQASRGSVQSAEQAVDQPFRERTNEPLDEQFSKPQLSAHDLEMFLYPDEEEIRWGHTGTAMTLKKGFVHEVNTILRCENQIARYAKDLEHAENQLATMTELVPELEQQIDELADDKHEERAEKNDLLKFGINVCAELKITRTTLIEKLDKATQEMERPKKIIFGGLKRVFEKYNLLEDISGISDSGQEAGQEEEEAPKAPKQEEPVTPRASPTPTASEAERAAEEEARYAAYDRKEQLEGRVYNLNHRLDNWDLEYDDTLRDWKDALARGDTDDTKTVFDNHLFCIHQELIQDLVLSEQELEEAINDARAIGVVFGGSEQESHFQDYADDGYRISLEQEWVQDLDRNKIENWVNGLPDEEPPSPLEAPEGDADEWDVRSIDFGESISVIAEGKPRRRIDRWRSTVEQEHFSHFDGDGDIDMKDEHQHSHQNRRCRNTNTL